MPPLVYSLSRYILWRSQEPMDCLQSFFLMDTKTGQKLNLKMMQKHRAVVKATHLHQPFSATCMVVTSYHNIPTEVRSSWQWVDVKVTH